LEELRTSSPSDGAITEAQRIIEQPAADAQQSLEAVVQAVLAVDPALAAANAALVRGRYEEAAKRFGALPEAPSGSYRWAARQHLLAKSLAGAEQFRQAAQAWSDLAAALPDQAGVNGPALLEAAHAYRQVGKKLAAARLYKQWLEKYGEYRPALAQELTAFLQEVDAEYEHPLPELAKQMGQVGDKLASADLGEDTRKRQDYIAAVLEELIEKDSNDNKSKSNSSSSSQNQGSQGKSQPKSDPSQGQDPSENKSAQKNLPVSPAQRSVLRDGPGGPAGALGAMRPSDGGDDWGKLPPAQWQQMLESFCQTMPERYQSMIRDYYKSLSDLKP
jgi:tetratricopeptide (TPR) repeat protein